jgi:acyl-CoA thioesterase-2
MPTSVEELVDLLELEAIDANLFRGRQPITFLQRVFGGQVAGQALMAASRTAPEDMDVHSLHSYFLRPGDPNVPIIYDVERIRDGKSYATRRVEARQHGKSIYYQTVSFHRPEAALLDHQDVMPDALPVEESPLVLDLLRKMSPDAVKTWEQEWGILDLRLAGQTGPRGNLDASEHPSRARFWIRVAGQLPNEPLVHQAALTYLSDVTLLGTSLAAHGLRFSDPGVMAASLDHTVWFHRPFRADEWLLYDQVSPSAQGGRGLSIGRLFTEAGVLVATCAQEGVIRYTPPA